MAPGTVVRLPQEVCALQGIEREYNELDTVWFMAGSLFQNYPYDIPTEAFSLELFQQVGRHTACLHSAMSSCCKQ